MYDLKTFNGSYMSDQRDEHTCKNVQIWLLLCWYIA